MATITLPFSIENKVDDHDIGLFDSDLYKMLPPPLKKATEDNPHLLKYLRLVPISQVGLPQYFPELSRKMGDDKEPNIIYPVGGGIFSHILIDFRDSRNNYISIEPTLTMNIDPLMSEVEEKCIEYGDKLAEFDADGDKEKQLFDYKSSENCQAVLFHPKQSRICHGWYVGKGGAHRGAPTSPNLAMFGCNIESLNCRKS